MATTVKGTQSPLAPQPGFYYHYKHDPNGPINNYAYEVIGTGHHTEVTEEQVQNGVDPFFVIYRPLYKEASVYRLGRLFDIRPLQMFMEEVVKGEKKFPRFTRITNLETIERLKDLCKHLYGEAAL